MQYSGTTASALTYVAFLPCISCWSLVGWFLVLPVRQKQERKEGPSLRMMTTLMLFLFYFWSYFCCFCFCRRPDEAISNNYSHSRWNNWWTDRLSACLTDWPISTEMTISFYLLSSLPALWRIHISLYWRLVFATDSVEFSSDNFSTRWLVHINFENKISMTIKKTNNNLSIHVLWLLANTFKL